MFERCRTLIIVSATALLVVAVSSSAEVRATLRIEAAPPPVPRGRRRYPGGSGETSQERAIPHVGVEDAPGRPTRPDRSGHGDRLGLVGDDHDRIGEGCVLATEAGSTFECKLDAAPGSRCTSPAAYSGLSDGAHNFSARARDAAGNTDASPAASSFTVDTSDPDVTPPAADDGAIPGTGAVLRQDLGTSADPIPLWRKIESAYSTAERRQPAGAVQHLGWRPPSSDRAVRALARLSNTVHNHRYAVAR